VVTTVNREGSSDHECDLDEIDSLDEGLELLDHGHSSGRRRVFGNLYRLTMRTRNGEVA
jgi:hypothetical protein